MNMHDSKVDDCPGHPESAEGTQVQAHAHNHGRAEGIDLAALPTVPSGVTLYRISTMDCASEESEIRRALEAISGIHSLNFQLGSRTLAVDAPADLLPQILQGIRKAGFDPQPVAIQAAQGRQNDREAHGFTEGLPRLISALVLAIGAESISFLAPDALPWKIFGMVAAATAIGLAGQGS